METKTSQSASGPTYPEADKKKPGAARPAGEQTTNQSSGKTKFSPILTKYSLK
jgi:hypothetical protein